MSSIRNHRRRRKSPIGIFCLVSVGIALAAPRPVAATQDEEFAQPLPVTTTTVPVVASRPIAPKPKSELAHVRTVIRSNLYKDGLEQNVPAELMYELVRLFAHVVDFQRDIKPGDSFEVYFQQTWDAEKNVFRNGPIKFASITFGGKTLKLWRHVMADGTVDYFNSAGESARLHLMRSPVDGAEISSGFGLRKHPILGYTRLHKGLDFATGKGTPVYAAGIGDIEVAKRNGSYGNYVRVRHNGRYQTAYAHLSRIAENIVPGNKVKQGQVIGYVGSTGRSTGPHLHYEVFRDDKQVDPSTLKLPPERKLAGGELAKFQWQAALLNIRPTEAPKAVMDHPGLR